MKPNSMRHPDMISFVAGNGGMTGQMLSRNAWQHEAKVAIANVRLLQDAGVSAERPAGFGHAIAAAHRVAASVGGALVRLGGRLQGGKPATASDVRPAAPVSAPNQIAGRSVTVGAHRRFPMYMHTTPPMRANSSV